MKRRFGWRRICGCAVLLLLLSLLLAEFGSAAVFLVGIFAASAAWVFGRVRWTLRQERLARKRSEDAWEERRRREIEARRTACRRARYSPEERKLLEAGLQEALGPAAEWDEEETPEDLRIDAAFIPPTETLPFWKAVTLGAGACAGGEGAEPPRAELMLALPPDWSGGDRWPCRVLRDAARRFVIVDGCLSRSAPYRGLSILSAGFAGAVADSGFSGLPEIFPVVLPGNQRVFFYWLVPLLKPELDYFLRRGYRNLARRFSAGQPWADPERRPLAEPRLWFQEDVAPFVWSEDSGRFCLGLETGRFCQEIFFSAGLEGSGWDWERLVREYLRRYQPDDGPFVEYACEERVFFAASEDREIMEQLALGLRDLLRENRAEARSLLAPDGR